MSLADALSEANTTAAPLRPEERALLEFAQQLTHRPAEVSNTDVERLRQVGWDDPQIAEAIYIISLFAFFNRVADAFGLVDPGYRAKRTSSLA
ncbi:MAG TPA: hypothetical protein VN285_04265 [Candidatus Deferrimicrobium sp.]|nr:hypothetical protein [Candidatus Deferrimicrobium sp.]